MGNKFIIFHHTPKFRNNYNIILGVNFKNMGGIRFDYCDTNKEWLAFKGGDEIGVLNQYGKEFAESCCNPESVKKLIYSI